MIDDGREPTTSKRGALHHLKETFTRGRHHGDRFMPEQNADRDPVEQLAEAFVERLRKGERPLLREYAEEYPELAERIQELFPVVEVMEKVGCFSLF